MSEPFSKGAEWSSSEKERFSRAALEPSPSSCSERGAYWEQLGFALEVDMSRGGQRVEKSEREVKEGALWVEAINVKADGGTCAR